MPARTWGTGRVVEEVLEEVQAVFGDPEDVVVVEVRLEDWRQYATRGCHRC